MKRWLYGSIALLAADAVLAQGATPTLNAGDTAWMLTATALVLFMTIPGLSLFYGGLVRAKNVLSVLMQCFAITSAVTVRRRARGVCSVVAWRTIQRLAAAIASTAATSTSLTTSHAP